MPWNGSGEFDLTIDFVADKLSGPPNSSILASRMMTQLSDLAQGIQKCIARNGESPPTADIAMGNYKLTGSAAASNRTHLPLASQVSGGDLLVPSAYTGSTASAWAFTMSFNPTAYKTGQVIRGMCPVENTGALTINVNSIGAKSVKMPNGTDPAAGLFEVGDAFEFCYDGTNFVVNVGYTIIAASAIAFDPTGTLVATNVQAALAEIDGDVSTLASAVGTHTTVINDHETRLDTVEANKANLASADFTVLKVGMKNVEIDTVVQTIAATSGTINTDMANGQVIDITLNGNSTFNVPSNGLAGDVVVFRIRQDATGSRTGSWAVGFKWPGGVVPALSTTGAAIDRVTGIFRDANTVEMGPLFRAFA